VVEQPTNVKKRIEAEKERTDDGETLLHGSAPLLQLSEQESSNGPRLARLRAAGGRLGRLAGDALL